MARLGITSPNLRNTKGMQILIYLLDRAHKIAATQNNTLETLILSNCKIKLKTAFSRLNHVSLSRVLTSFIKGYSFQPNRQMGP